jgi:hypothetical protein
MDNISRVLKSNLANKLSDSLKFTKFPSNSFNFKIQNDMLSDLQSGLSKKSLDDIKLNIQNKVQGTLDSNVTGRTNYTYKDQLIDDTVNDININPSKYGIDDATKRTLIESYGDLRTAINNNITIRLDDIETARLADDIKNTKYLELDPEVNRTSDLLRNDPDVKNRGIADPEPESTPQKFLDSYSKNNTRPRKNPGEETEASAKQEAKDLTNRNGNTKYYIAGSVILGSALFAWGLYNYLSRRNQESNIIKLEKVNNETLKVTYDSEIDWCDGDKAKIELVENILGNNDNVSGTFSFDYINETTIKFKPGVTIKSVPSSTSSSQEIYGTVKCETTYFNSLTCVIKQITKAASEVAGAVADATGLTDFLKKSVEFLKKSGLIIGGVILGIIILYIALKFFVFRGGDSTEIKLISPSSNARYYYN